MKSCASTLYFLLLIYSLFTLLSVSSCAHKSQMELDVEAILNTPDLTKNNTK